MVGISDPEPGITRLERWLHDIFADAVQPHPEVCSADVALRAVALAQHLAMYLMTCRAR